MSQGAKGAFRVYIYNATGTASPKIVSRARVTLGGSNSAPIEKWIEVTLNKTSKFSNGLVAKNSIVFNGNNASVDSWNSVKDHTTGVTRPSVVPFSNGVRNDNGSVGSISIASDAVLVKNADVWGYVATGGADPTAFVGSTGSILGDDSPAGPKVDPARVSTNFSASFDPVAVPTQTAIIHLGNIDSDLELPRAADVATGFFTGADGQKYYMYDAAKIDLVGEVLTISKNVILRLSASDAIKIGGGTGTIAVGATGSIGIYTDGSIDIAGQGVSNGVDTGGSPDITQSEMGQPAKFQIWGTKVTGSQSIKVAGTGLFSGVIYAPQGDVTITGNGAISGSVVANNITLGGNAAFHYDESLGDFGGGNPFRVSKWKELTLGTERDALTSVLTFTTP